MLYCWRLLTDPHNRNKVFRSNSLLFVLAYGATKSKSDKVIGLSGNGTSLYAESIANQTFAKHVGGNERCSEIVQTVNEIVSSRARCRKNAAEKF